MRREAHNVRKTLKKVQNASRMYVLNMCGCKKWVLQPQFTYRQPPQAHSAHSNMGGSEALTIKRGLLILTELATNSTALGEDATATGTEPLAPNVALTLGQNSGSSEYSFSVDYYLCL